MGPPKSTRSALRVPQRYPMRQSNATAVRSSLQKHSFASNKTARTRCVVAFLYNSHLGAVFGTSPVAGCSVIFVDSSVWQSRIPGGTRRKQINVLHKKYRYVKRACHDTRLHSTLFLARAIGGFARRALNSPKIGVRLSSVGCFTVQTFKKEQRPKQGIPCTYFSGQNRVYM